MKFREMELKEKLVYFVFQVLPWIIAITAGILTLITVISSLWEYFR